MTGAIPVNIILREIVTPNIKLHMEDIKGKNAKRTFWNVETEDKGDDLKRQRFKSINLENIYCYIHHIIVVEFLKF